MGTGRKRALSPYGQVNAAELGDGEEEQYTNRMQSRGSCLGAQTGTGMLVMPDSLMKRHKTQRKSRHCAMLFKNNKQVVRPKNQDVMEMTF